MNLKSGDIITLDNGEKVKVTLEVIEEKVTELEPSKKYLLRNSGEFCSTSGFEADWNARNIGIFVGTIQLPPGKRNIFYSFGRGYYMFGTGKLDYIVKKLD